MPTDSLSFAVTELNEYNDVFLLKPGGVYAFYSSVGECLYVGKSVDLRKRLMTHISSSPFNREISSVVVYFISNVAERDIYETYAINEFKAKYNKDKVANRRSLRVNVEQLEELTYELMQLKQLRSDLLYELRSLDASYGKPGKVRFINNFTGETSKNYSDHKEYETWFKMEKESEFLEEKAEIKNRIKETEDEIEDLRSKRRELFIKIRT